MLFDKLLRRDKPDEELGNGVQSPSPIHYDPKLTTDLCKEHRVLLDEFELLARAHADGATAAAASRLESFGGLLNTHILKEDFRLYVYLENALAGDARTSALVRDFHREMNAAGRTAMLFLTKYRTVAASAVFPEGFADDLAELGQMLKERIDREERILYPMYLPAY